MEDRFQNRNYHLTLPRLDILVRTICNIDSVVQGKKPTTLNMLSIKSISYCKLSMKLDCKVNVTGAVG